LKVRSPVPRRRTRIEIIPLIDIMFFLLASFMMVSLQMQKVQTLRANLPTATQVKSDSKPQLINLTVDRFGQVFLEGERQVSLTELERTLTERLRANAELPVYITGNKHTTHGAMIFVLDFVRRAGAQKVAFAVKARE